MVKVYKDRQSNFTHIKNDIFNTEKHDEINTLTWKAIGIFTYMWHLPDDWEFYEDELASHVKDGKAGLRSGLKELAQAGFIKRKWKRNADGKFASYDWILCESPFCDFPKTDKPKTDKPISDNRKLLSTKDTKYLNNKVRSSGSGESATQNQAVQKPSEPQPNSTPKINPKKNPYELYQQLWGFPNAIVRQDLQEWINDFSSDVVYYAIYTAGKNSVSSYGAGKYLNKIFSTWEKEKVTNLEQAKEQNEQHEQLNDRNHKARSNYNRGKHIREELPDWAKDKPKQQPKADKPVDLNQKQRVKEMMKEIDGN